MTLRAANPRLLLLGLALLLLAGCGDDENPASPDLVTISGVVRNIDTLENAPGARVSLLGTGYRDDVPTGTDGRYSLQVPRGSVLDLHTDDFDPSTADVWFPLINVDLPPVVANDDMLDWPIHTCPITDCADDGSVGGWDYYLANQDSANGDLFVPTSSASSAGIFAWLIMRCDSGSISFFTEGINVTSQSPFFPIGRVRRGGLNCDPSESRLLPSGTLENAGMVLAFGDPEFAGESVTLEITDVLSRGLDFASPSTFPMRPGTITLCLSGSIDGVPNKNFREIACCADLFECE